jgi:AmmeMemoRadiSam system protein B
VLAWRENSIMQPMRTVRPAAVAGMFYPEAPRALEGSVRALLSVAPRPAASAAASYPKALIVPHAGYVYSGPIAASAYVRLFTSRSRIHRVVLLGPVHRVPVRGLVLPGANTFTTPLGAVAVDADAVMQLRALPQVSESEAAHSLEHSLEVQLPFLQTVLDEFTLVPLAVGDATPAEVADVIERLWGGPETLIVVSSDLSHYHPYEDATEIDRCTADDILALASTLDHDQACGATPINGFALCARRHGLTPELIDLRNSGDTAGDKSRVVGYGAFAFAQSAPEGIAVRHLEEPVDA